MNSRARVNALSRRLDLTRLGIFGHSLGGAVAGLACMTDARFKAGINLDGFQWGPVADSVISQPFMFVSSEPFAGANDYIVDRFTNTLYTITVRGSTHMNFEDAPVVLPITKTMGMAGSISPIRMTRMTNDYLLAFFDRFLGDGASTRLDDLARDYPEAQAEVLR